jgi:hypothetical protein
MVTPVSFKRGHHWLLSQIGFLRSSLGWRTAGDPKGPPNPVPPPSPLRTDVEIFQKPTRESIIAVHTTFYECKDYSALGRKSSGLSG